MSKRIKIEVGQIWMDPDDRLHRKIIKIEGGKVWRSIDGEEAIFCLVDKNNEADPDLALAWVLVSSSPIKTINKECPCGIFRGDCDYHR